MQNKKLRITLPFQAGQFQRYTTNTDLYAQSDGFGHEDLDELFGIMSRSQRNNTHGRRSKTNVPVRLKSSAKNFQPDNTYARRSKTNIRLKASAKSFRPDNTRAHRLKTTIPAVPPPPALPVPRITKKQYTRIAKKQKRWWHELDDVDPISLEPLATMEYPPFQLKSNDDSSNESVRHIRGAPSRS